MASRTRKLANSPLAHYNEGMNEQPTNETWLSLAQAADRFNVHPTTLRRWANKGQIPYILTPGGHRRFALSAIESFLSQSELNGQTSPPEQWADKALIHTRQGIDTQSSMGWMMAIGEERRLQYRELGQDLMGMVLQFISGNGDDEHMLTEARKIGLQHGRLGRDEGLSLADALSASLFFRDKLIEAALHLPESTHIRPQENIRLMQRINMLVNQVHLAVASAYEE